MKIIYLTSFFLGISSCLFAQKQENNLAWIERNLTSIFDSLKIQNILGEDSLLLQTGVVTDEKSGFIKNYLINYAGSVQKSANQPSQKTVHIEQFETDIVYLQNSTGVLNLQTVYTRVNSIILKGWIANKKGQILKSIDVNKSFTEKPVSASFKFLEQSPYSFTRGKTVELSFWTEIMEPVLVGTALTAMAYLFFSVRS